jgi:hypothetical protein
LATVGQAVKNQGGDWNSAQGELQRYLKTLEESTKFSQGEALEAINSLTSSGISLADSEKIVAIATDVATAHHISLMEVVDRIKAAEAGRARGLVQLDENLKGIIARHGTLQEVMDQLARDTAGQASSATETLDGKWAMVKNTLEETSKEIGLELMPILMASADVVLDLAKQFESSTPSIVQNVANWTRAVGDFLDRLAAVRGFLADVAAGAQSALALPGQVINDLFQHAGDPGDAGSAAFAAYRAAHSGQGGGFGDPNAKGSATGDALRGLGVTDIAQKIRDDIENARKELDKYRNQPLGNNPIMGTAKSGGSGGPQTFEETPDALAPGPKQDAVVESGKKLDDLLKNLKDSELGYSTAIKLATTDQEKASATMALASKTTSDATIAYDLLTDALAAEKQHLADLNVEAPKLHTSYESARQAYDAYRQSLVGGGKESEAEKQHLADLKRAMDDAKKAYDENKTAVGELTRQLDAHNHALAESRVHMQAMAELQAELERKTEAASQAIFKQSEAIQKQAETAKSKRLDLIQGLLDEEATYKKSLELQAAYYLARYEATVAGDERERAESAKYYADFIKVETEIYKQRVDAQAQFIKDAEAREKTLLDDLLAKHLSLRDALKNVWKSILGDYVQMIEEMILKSSFVGNLNRDLLGTFGGASGIPGLGGTPKTDPALLTPTTQTATNTFATTQAITGPVVTGLQGINATATQGNTFLAQILAAIQAQTAQLASADSTSGTSGLNVAVQSIGGQSGADIANAGGGSWAAAAGGGGGFLGLLTAGASTIGAGFGLASTANGLVGGNQGNGAIGAAVGGAGMIGAALASGVALLPLLATPAGIALVVGAMVVGGLFGGLFGDHTTPAGSPDIYDTKNYGQGVANLTGRVAGANGQTFYPTQAVSAATGGQGGISWVEEQLYGAKQITSGGDKGEYTLPDGTILTPQQYQQYISTFGASATGGGKLNFGHNIGQQWITGAAGASSNPQSYKTLDQMLSYLLNQGGTTNPSVFQVTRTYPDFIGTSSYQGIYAPPPGGYASGPLGSGGAGGTNSQTIGLGGVGKNVTVNIGNVFGGGSKEVFVQMVAQALRELDLGYLPGAGSGASWKYRGN